eukprot:Awhi_evm1s6924
MNEIPTSQYIQVPVVLQKFIQDFTGLSQTFVTDCIDKGHIRVHINFCSKENDSKSKIIVNVNDEAPVVKDGFSKGWIENNNNSDINISVICDKMMLVFPGDTVEMHSKSWGHLPQNKQTIDNSEWINIVHRYQRNNRTTNSSSASDGPNSTNGNNLVDNIKVFALFKPTKMDTIMIPKSSINHYNRICKEKINPRKGNMNNIAEDEDKKSNHNIENNDQRKKKKKGTKNTNIKGKANENNNNNLNIDMYHWMRSLSNRDSNSDAILSSSNSNGYDKALQDLGNETTATTTTTENNNNSNNIVSDNNNDCIRYCNNIYGNNNNDNDRNMDKNNHDTSHNNDSHKIFHK